MCHAIIAFAHVGSLSLPPDTITPYALSVLGTCSLHSLVHPLTHKFCLSVYSSDLLLRFWCLMRASRPADFVLPSHLTLLLCIGLFQVSSPGVASRASVKLTRLSYDAASCAGVSPVPYSQQQGTPSHPRQHLTRVPRLSAPLLQQVCSPVATVLQSRAAWQVSAICVALMLADLCLKSYIW